MIPLEWQTVSKYTYSGQDDYGMPVLSSTAVPMDMVLKQYQQMNVENPMYADITMIGLTKGSICTNDVISVGSQEFGVKYIIPTRTYTEAFLYERS